MDRSLLYRSVLRVSAVVSAFVLVFQSGLVSDQTALLFNETTQNLSAQVGMSVSVQPTEYNTITAELTKQQQLLAGREEQITAREIELGLADGSSGAASQTTTYLLAAILLIQLILLVLNYFLDYLRVREQKISTVTQ